MTHRGPLLTMTEPPVSMDEEFNVFTASVGRPRHVALAELAWSGAPALPAPQPGWFMRLYRAYGA